MEKHFGVVAGVISWVSLFLPWLRVGTLNFFLWGVSVKGEVHAGDVPDFFTFLSF